MLTRFWEDLISRPSGPMAFRFLLQPVMAGSFAIRDGFKDARFGRTPYFWAILHDPARRKSSLHEGFKATLRIIILGLAMDLIYQLSVFHAFYLLQAVFLTVTIAFLPYVLLRGPAARVYRWWLRKKTPRPGAS